MILDAYISGRAAIQFFFPGSILMFPEVKGGSMKVKGGARKLYARSIKVKGAACK